MKLINVFVMLVLLGLVSCSGAKNKNQDTNASEVASESDDLLEDSDFVVDSDDEDLMEEGKEPDDEDRVDEDENMVQNDIQDNAEQVVESTPVQLSGSDGVYTVEKGDTLMLIAFKVFGDYRKWKDIKAANQEALVNGLSEGMQLKYASNGFTWTPKGNPHLIKRGETLGTISNDKYGTNRRWKDIWNNNKPMIKDPNLIFAGFTLYYIPDREVASE